MSSWRNQSSLALPGRTVWECWSIGLKNRKFQGFSILVFELLPGPDLIYKPYLFYILLKNLLQ